MAGLKALAAGAVLIGSLAIGAPTGPGHQSVGRSSDGVRPKAATASATLAGAERRAASGCDRMAATWGSDRSSGSPLHPVRHIRRLVKLLRRGKTGCLRTGTYTRRETFVRRDWITLRSATDERATWRGRIVLKGRGDRLTHLNLDGSRGPRCHSRACGTLPSPTINGPDATIADNDIKSPDSGICVHPRAWRREIPNRFKILRNRIHDCGRHPRTGHDHGIYVADGKRGRILYNVIYDNADRGIQLYPDARRTVVAYNTVDGNGSGVVYSERSALNNVYDNVFTNSVARWNAETFNLYGHGNRFGGNCVRPSNRNPKYNENGGVALPRRVYQYKNRRARDSVYEARAAGDFRILPTSACAGKGAPGSVAAPHAP